MEQYQDKEEIKPLLRIGDLVLGKYQKKEEKFGGTLTLEQIRNVSNKVYEYNKSQKNPLKRFYISEPPKKKRCITNQRQSILKEIQEIINQERATSKEKKKYPPITGRALAMKLHWIETPDLFPAMSNAKDYKSRKLVTFSQGIFGIALKAKAKKLSTCK